MNVTSAQIYWMTRLDGFGGLFCIVLFVLILLLIVNVIGGFIAMDMAYDNCVRSYRDRNEVQNDEARMRRRFARAVKLGVAAFLLGVVMVLVPSTKQMAAIVIIPKIANSEIVSEMGDATKELVGLARDWMKTMSPVKSTPNP